MRLNIIMYGNLNLKLVNYDILQLFKFLLMITHTLSVLQDMAKIIITLFACVACNKMQIVGLLTLNTSVSP